MMGIIIIIGICFLVSAILNPEEHKTELTIFTIIAAIFGGFYDASGARSEWNKKKR